MPKPCEECGKWVERIKVGKDTGRAYNDDGTWHVAGNGTCVPNPNWKKKQKLNRAEWEAKNLIKANEKQESRGYSPLFGKGRK